jgi:hypothetical protein
LANSYLFFDLLEKSSCNDCELHSKSHLLIFCHRGCVPLLLLEAIFRFDVSRRLTGVVPWPSFICCSLQSISLPAEVPAMDGRIFEDSCIVTIYLDEGNTSICIEDCFVMDFSTVSIVRYFGRFREICIPLSISVIRDFAFSGCRNLEAVRIRDDSRLTTIEPRTFARCSSLRVISIPAINGFTPASLFTACPSLPNVRFNLR